MVEIKLYAKELDMIIEVMEGSGCNLSEEDETNGYVDYIMIEGYDLHGKEKGDLGAQVMLTKFFSEKFASVEDVILYLIETGFLPDTDYVVLEHNMGIVTHETSMDAGIVFSVMKDLPVSGSFLFDMTRKFLTDNYKNLLKLEHEQGILYLTCHVYSKLMKRKEELMFKSLYELLKEVVKPYVDGLMYIAANMIYDNLLVSFRKNMSSYEVEGVYPYSNSRDPYLWYVAARKKDGSYAYWTWNNSTESLNSGHYDLADLSELYDKIGTLRYNSSYTVDVTETLCRKVLVKAGSVDDAVEQVQGMYHKEEIVLDAEDLDSTNFECRSKFQIGE